MNKTCARCEKTVYPTEELKCLDKVWHKGCFKCQECGMTLNMRTYKGYGKLPYCEAHVPKAKPTTMAETPELKRIAENTKIQSNVKYHADFEKSKGKFTQVADDPETLRIKANTKIISNVAYHGELEKKAQMERQRQMNENGELVDVPSDNYHQQIDNYATEMLSPTMPPPNLPPKNHYHIPTTQYQPQVTHNQVPHNQVPHNQVPHNQVPHNQVLPTQHVPQQVVQPQSANRYPDQYYKPKEEYSYQYQDYPNHGQYYGGGQYTQNYGAAQPKIGRIQDYDPLSDGPRAPPNTQRASATVIYNSTSDKQRGAHQSQQPQSRQIGRVTDLDPLANELPRPPSTQNQRVYIAMYDYEANDSDEVSFREGDLITEASAIDEGWMTGRVARTGRAGMLPANYVEPAPHHAH
ncbi:hypothetical protein O3G_MSEX011199 [Manduca sexta]|uniref:LIM and SH3 domain protein Lasp n=1 Tax=Manduca sexta TaxID=7130 RepID=A0A921ZJB5_MANSE|nr:hypothetical protein O3G_MSEX011199 [Manduca sexta]